MIRRGASSGSILLWQLLACIVPVCMGLYWPVYPSNPSLVAMIFRPLTLATTLALCFFFSYGTPVTQAEKRLAGVLVLFCAILLAPCLTATNPARALQDWLKLLVLCAFSLMLCRALRYPPVAKAFGAALLAASAVIAVLMIVTYLRYMGWTPPTYTAVRILKGAAARAGIPLNPISFACVFAYVSAMCLLRGTALLWSLGLTILAISSALTGSRAPLALVLGSSLALIVLNALRSRRLWVCVLGCVLAGAGIFGAFTVGVRFGPREISALTEGRSDLWTVAFQKFTERPIFGYGYESWSDDLISRLPGAALTREVGRDFQGGYHNEFLTALAEEGIIGFAALLALFWFLLRCCWRLAFRPFSTCRNGQWALLGGLFLLLRALIEVPGLFGYAQEPADFLAYIFLAIVVSRLSREEDDLRPRGGRMVWRKKQGPVRQPALALPHASRDAHPLPASSWQTGFKARPGL